MSSNKQQQLIQIVNQRELSSLYQPIVDMQDNRIIGYEALIRGPADGYFNAPINLFGAASQYGMLSALEMLAQEISVKHFSQLKLDGKLFLNISPNTLQEMSFHENETLDIIHQFGLNADQTVIEISEQYPLHDYETIKKATRLYKQLGFQLAIDDLGAGYAGLRSWSEICPDYVKIDRHFITGIQADQVKQDFVRSIIDISNSLNCRIIAEGLETQEELETICRMGIRYVQGYLLGRPLASPARYISRQLTRFNVNSGYKRPKHLTKTVAGLTVEVPAIPPDTTANKAIEIFRLSKDLQSLAVVADKQPLGLIYRTDMLELFASRYGRDLHGKKSITEFLRQTLVVDDRMAVEDVSKLITDKSQFDFSHDFIVTRDSHFLGVGHIRDLLKVITELQIKYARYSNPLTGLPGNVPIYETIDSLLSSRTGFRIAYCDLDHFKPFNDVYGYSRGDRIIQNLAIILNDNVDHETDFVGHIGGDDFVIIFRSSNWEQRCKKILDDFELSVVDHYDEEHIQMGGITAVDRKGNQMHYPLLSLSIGCVHPDPVCCSSHHAVASLATDAKFMSKKMDGNSLFIDDRRSTQGKPGRIRKQ